MPGSVVEEYTGRMVVSCEETNDRIFELIHGVSSYSPVVRCAASQLDLNAIAMARRFALGSTFCIRVKQVGRGSSSSRELARGLGRAVLGAVPHLSVDLRQPRTELGVEVRNEDCYLYDSITLGLDRKPVALRTYRGRPRFLVDQMLGTLVTWLRALGFDTAFSRDQADSLLLRKARAEKRVLVTRDRELSRARSARTVYVHACDPVKQAVEVLRSLSVAPAVELLFTRCIRCNGRVADVDKVAVRGRVPSDAFEAYNDFTWCDGCERMYWPGEQFRRLEQTIQSLLRETRGRPTAGRGP
jgi:uncharacterized protein with PIN domain